MKRATTILLLCIPVFFSCDDDPKPEEKPKGTLTFLNQSPDKGDFVLYFSKVESSLAMLNIRNKVNQDDMLINLIAQLNGMFSLPVDIPVTFQSIGETNAFYDPKTKSITFGLEFVQSFYQLFGKLYNTEAERWAATRYTVFFFLFHEMGHAMVDLFNITVHGEEEDAVDNFSVYLLTQGFDDGIDAALNAADYFKIIADYEGEIPLKYLPVQDEHSLDSKRLYNVLCRVYGTEPAKCVHLITKGFLNEEKAALCQDVALKNIQNWNKDLSYWIKSPAQ
jgi:hypothetical protein